MQATITYLLTEQAQRAQMAATGQPVARKQTHTIDITPEDLPLLDVDAEGRVYLDLATPVQISSDVRDARRIDLDRLPAQARRWRRQIFGDWISADMPEFSEPLTLDYLRHEQERYDERYAAAVLAHDAEIAERLTKHGKVSEEMLRDAIHATAGKRRDSELYGTKYLHSLMGPLTRTAYDELQRKKEEESAQQAAERAAKRAAVQPLVDAFLADPAARAVAVDSGYASWVDLRAPGGETVRVAHDVVDRDVIASLASEARKRWDSDAAARENAKTEYIAAWIAEHADDDTRQQFADGLLCRQTAVTMIAEAAFDAAGVGEALGDVVMCEDRNCPCSCTTLSCIPRRLYPRWREMRAKLPKGYTAEFESRRDCLKSDEPDWDERDQETASPKYWVVNLTIPCGPFRFDRTVKLG